MLLAVLTSARCLTGELGNFTRGNLFFSVGNRQLVISENTWQTPAHCKDSSLTVPKASLGIPWFSGTFLMEEQGRRLRCSFIRLQNSKTFKPINSKGYKPVTYIIMTQGSHSDKRIGIVSLGQLNKTPPCPIMCCSSQPAAVAQERVKKREI